MVGSLPGGIDDTGSSQPGEPNPLGELFDLVETLIGLYENKPTATLAKKILPEIDSLRKLARSRGLGSNPATNNAIDALQGRYDVVNREANKKIYPISATIYAHNSKDSNWQQAKELGLTEEAARNFAYTALEVSFTVLIYEDGTVKATHVNDVALVTPISL